MSTAITETVTSIINSNVIDTSTPAIIAVLVLDWGDLGGTSTGHVTVTVTTQQIY